MLAFRSEAHVDRWCKLRRLPRGEVFSLDQCWRLGEAWYGNRLEGDWRRWTPEEAHSLFDELGLTSSFWRLT